MVNKFMSKQFNSETDIPPPTYIYTRVHRHFKKVSELLDIFCTSIYKGHFGKKLIFRALSSLCHHFEENALFYTLKTGLKMEL